LECKFYGLIKKGIKLCSFPKYCYNLDDDLSVRIKTNKLEIIRHPTKLARYKMIRHKQQKLNPQAHENLKKAKSRLKKDGVNTIKYEVVKKTLYTGFTHFLFDIGTLDPKP
jgi:hypothetical protein